MARNVPALTPNAALVVTVVYFRWIDGRWRRSWGWCITAMMRRDSEPCTNAPSTKREKP